MEAKPFRVLSLDGGGIMGAFSASVLATIERVTGRRILDHFDLISGTSTGGIIAIALAMGITAQQTCDFYQNEGVTIFPARSGVDGWVGFFRDFFRPRFAASELRKAIEKVVGTKPLGESKTRLVVPSYDVNTGKVYLFKTPHHPGYLEHRDLPAVEVALATSAAPTYFPAHRIEGRGTFIDGGLWANCPALVGVVEALDFLGRQPEQVRLLSISTTSYPFRIDRPGKLRGLLGWAPKLVDTFMFGQAQVSVNAARCLLRKGRFCRIDHQVPPGHFDLARASAVKDLVEAGRILAELNENKKVAGEFLDGNHAEPFVPVPR